MRALPVDSTMPPRPDGYPVPLTAMQLYSWKYYSKQEMPLSVRMCAAALRIKGRLDTHLLAQSIDAVVSRHESLRTRFCVDDGMPRQVIDSNGLARFELVDLTSTSTHTAENHTLDLQVGEFLRERVDLSVGPMFAARLWRRSDQEHVLVLALDHIVGDSISNVILTREIWQLYSKGTLGETLSLPALSLQFPDYAVWQEQAHPTWRQKHEGYWKHRLEGAPTTQLPCDSGLELSLDPVVAVRHVGLGTLLSAQLRRIARHEEMPLPAVALTAYAFVMSQWCQQADLIVSFALHGRHNRPQLDGMIGFLVGFTFLRIDVSQEPTVVGLLRQVRQEFSAALEHQEYFMVPDTFPTNVTEIGFNWLPTKTTRDSVSRRKIGNGDINVQPYSPKGFPSYTPPKFAPFFYEGPSGIALTVYYRPDQIRCDTIDRFASDLRQAAEEIAQRAIVS